MQKVILLEFNELTPSLMDRFIAEGRLPAKRLPGGQFRIRRDEVLKLLREVEDEFAGR